jgi:hypothetical protein
VRAVATAFAGIVAVAGLLLGGSAPARAAAGSPEYVVMYSDGEWVGGGIQRQFDSGNAQISVSGSAAYVTVGVAGGTSGDYYDLDFAAPPGQVLAPGGIYTNAQRAPFREPGHAGIDISGSGRGCNEDTGLFEVKDIATDAGGAVSRLWIVYEQHCEGGTAALWGEVKIGESISGAPLLAPGIVRWPATDVGGATTVVPVTVTALSAPVTIGGAGLTGTNASDFTIRTNECAGQTLTVGSSCQIWVRFVPTAAGTRLATLRITDGTGSASDVALQGFAYGGTTKVDMTSDAGDYIGQGQKWSYTVANARISIGGGRTYAGFGVDGANGDWWYADFVPAQGDILTAGSTYANATRYPFNGVGPGLDVSGNGRGCNTLTGSFTVTAATFGADGLLRSAAITFVQHCEGATPALRGTFSYRAGDTTQPAPWMVPVTPPQPQPPPPPSPPSVTSFSPTSGPPGTLVTINGSSFTGTTGVTFGGATASFSMNSSSQMTATVPSNAPTGRVAVTTAAGTGVSTTDFTVTTPPSTPPPPPAPPTITAFAPSSGVPGTTVTLTGTNFTGATGVSFGGVGAVFNVNSATQITTAVPASAASGRISVSTPGGTAQSSNDFTVPSPPPPPQQQPPTIASFTPSAGAAGTTVTLTGTNLNGTTAVTFAGAAAVFNVNSATQITTVVPTGAVSGKVSVTTPGGTAQSTGDFVVSSAAPTPSPSPAPPPSSGGGGGGGGGISPDLHIDARASTTSAPAPGSELDFVVTVSSRNLGGSSAARLELTLPNGYALTRTYADRGPGCTVAATRVTCDVAWINGSVTTTVQIFGTVGQAGTQELTATVTSLVEPELNPADNTLTLKLEAPGAFTPPGATGTSATSARVVTPPRLVGRARVGETLRAVAPVWSSTPSHLGYQWQLCARGCSRLAGATRLTLKLAPRMAGRLVRFVASATIDGRTLVAATPKVRVAKR